MNFKKGTDRYVLTVPVVGIVIKICRFRIMHFFIQGFKSLFDKKTRWIFIFDCKRAYFRGLTANWREFTFWLRTRNEFLQPTYFSFFGLFNIQKFGKSVLMDDVNFIKQIQYYTKWFCWEDCHTIINLSNYVLDPEGKIRIVDYGNRQVRFVTIRFGQECHEKFRVDFDRTKEVLVEENTISQEYARFCEERRKNKAAS